MKKTYLSLLLLILSSLYLSAQEVIPIIPLPLKAEKHIGTFELDRNTPILASSDQLKDVVGYFRAEVLRLESMPLAIQKEAASPAISFVLDPQIQEEDAYEVNISPEGVEIKGRTVEGVFYGAASVLQLIKHGEKSEAHISIDSWNIQDKPQLKWRGLMLDESRFFMGKEKVKEMLDWMAYYKLNRFHWHLTDEPAWRVEIKKYPKLALVGGIGNYNDSHRPAEYYTQREIQEIVAYAASRNIEVIPEIDMPGHATAANRAYPQYSGGGSDGHPEFTFDPGNPETYSYLSNILKEINVLFPSNMVHLGGDEVSFGSEKWKKNERIQQLMEDNGFQDLKEVEYYFMKQMADSVYKMNAKLLVWDELADADLPNDKTIIYWWRHDKPQQLKKALEKGFETVLCPRLPLYFDFVQDSTHRIGRKWGNLYNPIEDVYNFSVNKWVENPDQLPLVKGIQANLWTETVTNLERVDYLIFPRIAALAETAWTAEDKKDYTGFEERLKSHLDVYRALGLYFFNPFNPGERLEPSFFRRETKPLVD